MSDVIVGGGRREEQPTLLALDPLASAPGSTRTDGDHRERLGDRSQHGTHAGRLVRRLRVEEHSRRASADEVGERLGTEDHERPGDGPGR